VNSSVTQKSLHTYANAVGSLIKSFEQNHMTMVATLDSQAKDRTNAAKKDALKRLGDDYKALGTLVSSLPSVPTAAQSINTNLGQAYVHVGEGLSKIADSGGDDKAFLGAITSYNQSSDAFARAYISLSSLLSLNNVVFAPADPGAIFSFSGQ
jgi:hypothetical protein